jgi:prolyl-tRNA editing enzyme YbaK/EbsC (Cys-tRNA(Pro) deacylase)
MAQVRTWLNRGSACCQKPCQMSRQMAVHAASIADRPVVAIGGGAPGVNLHLAPADLVTALRADLADVTQAEAAPA